MDNTIDEHVIMGEKKINPMEREFVGKLRCQLLRVELEPESGITTIDVRVREESKILREEIWQ
jgi:hypothetical protein